MNDKVVDYCKTCYHTRDDHKYQYQPVVNGTIKLACCFEGNCKCEDFIHGETRVTSSTGASKGTKDARYDLIPIPALDALARLYGFGAKKYAAHNWRLGYDWSKSYAAAQRHMAAFWAGENIDPESGAPHVINAAFHMFALATYLEEHPEFDDRFETTIAQPSPEEGAEVLTRLGEVEKAANWLAIQPDGETITFGTDYSDEEINKIFDRALKIKEKTHPHPSTSFLTTYPTAPLYHRGRGEITIPEIIGVEYRLRDNHDRAVGNKFTITKNTEIYARPLKGYLFPEGLDTDWQFIV